MSTATLVGPADFLALREAARRVNAHHCSTGAAGDPDAALLCDGCDAAYQAYYGLQYWQVSPEVLAGVGGECESFDSFCAGHGWHQDDDFSGYFAKWLEEVA